MNSFYVFEGCDGVGKTTVRDIVCEELNKLGFFTITTGQHSWTNPWVSRLLIHLRENMENFDSNSIKEAYFLDKIQHVKSFIQPNLSKCSIISDRYIFSDAVYMEALYNIPAEQTLDRYMKMDMLEPKKIIYVFVSVEEAYKRILKRNKQSKHYEKPADMKKIMAVYERVLFKKKHPIISEVISFDNSTPNYKEKIIEELIPKLLY